MRTSELFLGRVSPADARALLREWCWLIDPDAVRPVMLTTFGDWILEDRRTGKVTFLDTAVGRVRDLAPSREAMRQVLKEPERRQFFLLEGQVRRLREDGVHLAPGQCYGWKVAPRLGGGLDVDNIQTLALELHQRAQSRLTWALRDCASTAALPPEAADQIAELLERAMTPDGPKPPLNVKALVVRGAAVALAVAILALQVL